jgi:3-polyprenyl-4-hydroxybenzoate decarboxylase
MIVPPESKSSNAARPKDQSFRSFLQELERRGELIRFIKSVDPLRNMSAVEWKTYN